MKPEKKIEVDYYGEISAHIKELIIANLPDSKNYRIEILIGELYSALNTLIANGALSGSELLKFGRKAPRLFLDITLVIENVKTGKFELVIFEIKKKKRVGLNELSQLIGYCLVSKSKFGILMNVDNAISRELSDILDADPDLTKIARVIDEKKIIHRLGIMTWNSSTHKIGYIEAGCIKTIPELVKKIVLNLE